jgi:hypothetical protein
LELSAEGREISLTIKLHPINQRSKETYIREFGNTKNVRILLGNEPPSTFELISGANFHLSVSSSCHYDALGLGVPTVILPFSGHEDVLDLYERGHAFFAKTPQDLAEIVCTYQNLQVQKAVSSLYFKSGAIKNMIENLDHLKVSDKIPKNS